MRRVLLPVLLPVLAAALLGGSPVEPVVAGDVADEVHVHGYERRAFVTAGASVTLRFVADVPGVVEVEPEGPGSRRPGSRSPDARRRRRGRQRLAPRSDPVVSEPFWSASRMQTISRSPSSQVSALGTSVEK